LSTTRGTARIIFALRYELAVPYPEVSGDPKSRGPLHVRVLAIVDENGNFLIFERYEELKDFVDAQGGGGLVTPAHLSGAPPQLEACEDTPVIFGSLPAREPWTIVTSGEKGLYRLTWDAQQSALVGATKYPSAEDRLARCGLSMKT